MSHLGTGICDNGYYRGWDGKGIESQEACNAVCLSEAQCTYAAWYNGKTCSRYQGKTCNIQSGSSDWDMHVTYTKQPGDRGKF